MQERLWIIGEMQMSRNMDNKRIRDRNRNRNNRYGNWRQHYCDSDGMCQGKDFEFDGMVWCGETNALEFHEIRDGEGRVVKIILLCPKHHDLAPEHKDGVTISHSSRHYPSMLQEDVQREIQDCGGLEAWKTKYHLS